MTIPPDVRARAMTLAVAQDFGDEALALNKRLVEADASDTASRTRLARCYLQAGKIDEADAEYREALRIDPRSRIAAGGLEMVEALRHPASAREERAHIPRAPRVRREGPGPGQHREAESAAVSEPIPRIFNGFTAADFSELRSCPRREVAARFAPRVVDLVRRVNVLQSSIEAAGVREPGKRQLFRASRADVHADQAHWHVFNQGGRWEPQFNIGMYGGRSAGNWLRIGIGYDFADEGRDANRETGGTAIRDHLRHLQEILASPRRSLFLGWMVKEGGFIQDGGAGPRQDVREPSQAASLIGGIDPDRAEWIFFGKWLSPDTPDEAAVLADPVSLVRTIDRVVAGLVPLWRALWTA